MWTFLNTSIDMTDQELFQYRCLYLEDALTYEESRSMGYEGFKSYVRMHVFPIPKAELIAGETYPGYCRNARRATWDGNVFHYTREKFGSKFEEKINHYEDDNGMDVFVPIKEV